MESCKGCWWQEGGKCYEGKPERDADGRSVKDASERCDKFTTKRDVLSSIIPNDKLIIASELRTPIDDSYTKNRKDFKMY